jgi:L-ascorbate metabolism protein UlaG (beta-lactamase superfamily)
VTDGPDAPAPPAPPPRPSRRRRVVFGALGALALVPVLVVVVFTIAMRHVPWSVPDALRAPAAPAVGSQGGLWVRYLGITGYEVTDGTTTLLLDPTFTRPTGVELLAPVESDAELVAKHVTKADFVLVNHTHHDHALDVPEVAKRTKAVVLGSPSTLNLCRSRGVDASQLREARAGDRLTLGTFTVDVRASVHTSLGPLHGLMSGVMSPEPGRLWFWQLTQDGCLAYRLSAGGATLWWHPTSTYAPGELGGLEAATLILGVTGEEITEPKARLILGEVKPRRVLVTHHDNFFQPLSKGMSLMPGLDLEAARSAIDAAQPGVPVWVQDHGNVVHLPPD